jgi:arylsulfatase A-like enzyme
VFTVAEGAREAGVVTAMLTANPSTTAPFGFARGWETFVAHVPGEDVPATTVFEDAGRWLDAHKNDRFFVVIHARGGHPPWDVTSEELKELPPTGYAGSLEPKHAGEALAKARKAAGARVFTDPDRERAFALHEKALVAHDTALGALVARVRTMGRDKDTVWIVTSDIGIDAAAHVPFLEEESLEEGALAVPLIMRAPGKGPRERVTTATSVIDVSRTILEALGLPPPPHLRGESLWKVAADKKAKAERPLIAATTTRFSARWGTFAVVGAREREVKVCNLSLDPDCVSDVRPSHALAAEALHALAWTELVKKPEPSRGAPADPAAIPPMTSPMPNASATRVTPDGPTSAALRAWGR